MNHGGLIAKASALAFVITMLLACDSNSGGSANKAQFVDSEVIGISYQTSSAKQGVTDAQGRFAFSQGDTVTFYIGEIVLPNGIPQGNSPQGYIITPAHLAGTADWEEDATTLNIIRFLLTIDEDGKSNNGIQIPSIAVDLASEPLDFSVDDEEFAESVKRFFEDLSNELEREFVLIDQEQARKHFRKTLKTLDITIEIQIIEAGVPCTVLNTAGAVGTYSTTLTTVIGEPSYLGEMNIEVEGMNISLNDTLINASECTYTQATENDLINTDTWTWKDEEDTFSFVKTSGVTEGITFTVREDEGAAVSSGALTELAPD